jgi:hypothetical protein
MNVLFELSSVSSRLDDKKHSSPEGGRTFSIHVDGNDGYTCSPDRNYYYQIARCAYDDEEGDLTATFKMHDEKYDPTEIAKVVDSFFRDVEDDAPAAEIDIDAIAEKVLLEKYQRLVGNTTWGRYDHSSCFSCIGIFGLEFCARDMVNLSGRRIEVSAMRIQIYFFSIFRLLAEEHGFTEYADPIVCWKIAVAIVKFKCLLRAPDLNNGKFVSKTEQKVPYDATVMNMNELDNFMNYGSPDGPTFGQYLAHGVIPIDPVFDFGKYFALLGVSREDVSVSMTVPTSVRNLNQAMKFPHLRDYMVAGCFESLNVHLKGKFAALQYDLLEKAFYDSNAAPAEWSTSLRLSEVFYGDTIGKLYVEKYHTTEIQAQAERIVSSIRDALREEITDCKWIGEVTRGEALKKLDGIKQKVGVSTEVVDEIIRGESGEESHVRNVISCRRTYFDLNVKNAFRKPETLCMPHTINAYYNPTANEIIIPMGFLQSPLLDITADLAVQYGSFGAMVGHELTHGFDCLGRHYDAMGNVRNWWSEKDSDECDRRSMKMMKQIQDMLKPDPREIRTAQQEEEELLSDKQLTTIHCESIADVGGLSLAIRAFQKLIDSGEVSLDERIDNFPPWERMFITWAKTWREINQTSKNPYTKNLHGPSDFRANSAPRNCAKFHEVFGVEAHNSMFCPPDHQFSMW